MTVMRHDDAMRAGDVLWNPLTGEKALTLESAADSGGARIVVELAVEAGGFVPGGDRVHDACTEHFEQAIRVIGGLCADGLTDELRFRSPSDPVQRLVFGPWPATWTSRPHPSVGLGLGRLPERVMRP